MRNIRSGGIAVLTVGLLAASAVGAAAQDDGLDSMEPAVFVWEVVDGSDAGITIEASDPRASGFLSPGTFEPMLYVGGRGYALALFGGDATLATEGGTWTGASEGVNAERFLAPQVDRGVQITELTGEGAYDGLSLTLYSIGLEGDEDPEQWGYIYPTDAVATTD